LSLFVSVFTVIRVQLIHIAFNSFKGILILFYLLQRKLVILILLKTKMPLSGMKVLVIFGIPSHYSLSIPIYSSDYLFIAA
jgi:hypothetical protein